jgi:uncharacterized protein
MPEVCRSVTLSNRLQQDLQQAIRDRNELRRDTLRMAIAAAYNTSKQHGRDLTDDEMIHVLTREVKTRRESVEAFAGAGRQDAADKEQAEIAILTAYLPAQLDEAEVTRLVKETIGEVGASSPREMGKVMAALMPKVRGRADGKVVSSAVARELAAVDLAGHGH